MYVSKSWSCGMMLCLVFGIAGCRQSEERAARLPTNADVSQSANFVIGAPDNAAWGGYYHHNDEFFTVNIPIFGAMKIEYTVKRGGQYAIFMETTQAVKAEIGLKTIDGVVDELERVCVTYTEHRLFLRTPTESVKTELWGQTHYRRPLANDEIAVWWPVDAAFEFDGDTQTVCVMLDGVMQVAESGGAFPKPTPEVPVVPPVPFMLITVTGAETDLQNLLEFKVDEPDASQSGILYDGVAWQTADGTKAKATTPVAPVTQLQIAVAPDPALTGVYTVTVSNDANDWAGAGGCPASPPAPSTLTFTLTLTTNAGVKTCACTPLPCVNDGRIALDVTFPAGTSTIKPSILVPPPCTCN